jgi:hypothetical protein
MKTKYSIDDLYVFTGFESEKKTLKQNVRVKYEDKMFRLVGGDEKNLIPINPEHSAFHRPLTEEEYQELFT